MTERRKHDLGMNYYRESGLYAMQGDDRCGAHAHMTPAELIDGLRRGDAQKSEGAMSKQFTPGPWTVRPLGRRRRIVQTKRAGWRFDTTDNTVCRPITDEHFDEQIIATVDGRAVEFGPLLAAAPQMAEALRLFVTYARNGAHPQLAAYLDTIAGAGMIDALRAAGVEG